MNKLIKFFIIFYSISIMQYLYAFDHQHQQWHSILQQNVHLIANGTTSRVDYENIKKNSASLTRYLELLSSVSKNEFKQVV